MSGRVDLQQNIILNHFETPCIQTYNNMTVNFNRLPSARNPPTKPSTNKSTGVL